MTDNTRAFTSARFVEIPLEQLTTPKDGHRVLANRWWATRNGNPLAWQIYPGKNRYLSPQCNDDKRITERLWPHETPLFVPVAYWPEDAA